ncbi:hypothetical protein DNX69_15610 [Rhodopseudomonas palustris]|uniref:Uncharacterized protein n=1 Tax=Rhodopseudomonas palustris TaxID=1076 RepID=A0A323UF60_RHOPL|nr:hypothetical protein DNX69_15610 [Rhodopseudomonas palustris]
MHAQAAQSSDPVEVSGYRHSVEGRSLLESASTAANAVLSASSSFRLQQSWEVEGNGASTPSAIKLFLIAVTPQPFVIQVRFRSCRCIFVQAEAFRTKVSRYAQDSEMTSKIDASHLLAFMLLHEVGHQQEGHPGYMDRESPDLNFDDNEVKARERAADEFAAKALIAAGKDRTRIDAFLSAMEIELALSKVSFNLAGIRVIGSFGGSTLCAKDLFADRGVSHPNFELRILTVNDIITDTPTSHQLVVDFERCRQNSVK